MESLLESGEMLDEEADNMPRQPTIAGSQVSARTRRTKPTIGVVYYSVANGESILATLAKYDGVVSDMDTLYEKWGDTSIKPQSFRVRLASYETYKQVFRSRNQVFITELGRSAVSNDMGVRTQARQQAFLNVELNRALLQRYVGRTLPPNTELDREIHEMGVPESSTDSARQIFLRSAKEAGFLSDDSNVLTLPDGVEMPTPDTAPRDASNDVQEDTPMVTPVQTIPQPQPQPPVDTPVGQEPKRGGAPSNDMDGVMEMVWSRHPSFDAPVSEDALETWRQWLNSTIDYMKVLSRQR